MEEDKYVVEGGAQFVGQHFELLKGRDHMEDILLHDEKALTAEPDDVEVQVQALCRAGWIELS